MLIFLDLETTGVESSDLLCSVGVIAESQEGIVLFDELFNEGKKIPPKAASIHHISNEMILHKGAFRESELYLFLQKHNSPNTTLIAHNAPFDIQKLSLSGLEWRGGMIDTLRVARHLIPECELFSLQVLRYELQLYKQEQEEARICGIKDAIVAHNALSDALVVKQLYEYLLDIERHEKMLELSLSNVLIQKLNFGKYKGSYIEELAMSDRAYLEWMLRLDDLDEDLRYSIEYYL